MAGFYNKYFSSLLWKPKNILVASIASTQTENLQSEFAVQISKGKKSHYSLSPLDGVSAEINNITYAAVNSTSSSASYHYTFPLMAKSMLFLRQCTTLYHVWYTLTSQTKLLARSAFVEQKPKFVELVRRVEQVEHVEQSVEQIFLNCSQAHS